jgi:primosomal protein N' (replication factor Y)
MRSPALSFAEVSVNSPAGERQLFSYSIPEGLKVIPGSGVWIPFGNRTLQGIVVEISEFPSVESTRPIASLIQAGPLLSNTQLELAAWISRYYFSPLFAAIALFLPPGFERQPLTLLKAADKTGPALPDLSDEQLRFLKSIEERSPIRLKQLEKEFGKKASQKLASQLVNRGLVNRSFEFERERVTPKLENRVNLTASEPIESVIAELAKKRAARQASLVRFLNAQQTPLPLTDVYKAGFSRVLVNSLAEQGIIKLIPFEIKREPIDYSRITQSSALILTPAQETALSAITKNLKSGKPGVFVLHGVTGSGKTEVYLQALAEAFKLGKRGIALVPEIALTPQTIERFASRFPHRVAVLHSRLSLGEQFDQWRDIRAGEYDVVIGPRGALFAPQPDLGLIILDEEHEWTYKQTEQAPRYHARDVALKLAELTGATITTQGQAIILFLSCPSASRHGPVLPCPESNL